MTSNDKKYVQPTVENLEDRCVPAVVFAPDANGTILVRGDNTSETIRVVQSGSSISINGKAINARGATGMVFEMNGGNDFIDARRLNLPTIMRGGAGNDVFFGGTQTDRMYGDGDNDRLFGEGGYDYLYGGAGSDFLDDGNRSGHEWYSDESNDRAFDSVADVISPAGGFRASHVSQGSGSKTCTFLATLGSAAQSGVNFNNYISYLGHDENGFGVYNVKLYNGRQWVNFRIEYTGHTYTQDAQPTVDNASWTILMNRAWIAMHGNAGASSEEGMRALGYRTQTYRFQSDNEFAILANHLAAGGMAVSGTHSNYVSTNVLTTRHAYQVVQAGYRNGVAMVQVRNPWGIDIDHRWTPDGNNDGYIWITWAHFKASMSEFSLGGR